MGASPLGMIAGQGALPLRIAQAQRAAGRDVFILGILNEAEKAIESFPHEWIQMGALRWAADRLKAAGCKEIWLPLTMALSGVHRLLGAHIEINNIRDRLKY